MGFRGKPGEQNTVFPAFFLDLLEIVHPILRSLLFYWDNSNFLGCFVECLLVNQRKHVQKIGYFYWEIQKVMTCLFLGILMDKNPRLSERSFEICYGESDWDNHL